MTTLDPCHAWLSPATRRLNTPAYYRHCLHVAATVPPGETRDWWYLRAGASYTAQTTKENR